ncbi:cyclophilin-like fold protein [Rhizobium sp. YIM 134829]|uniref:cyclophilin-like fold protein n=1 Tax=Rhizobium sp. YIM 134829 TaxID=3390453 RepID=UPI00397B923E
MRGAATTDRRRLIIGAAALALLAGRSHAATHANKQEKTAMRIGMRFAGRDLTATLFDNPSARDFFSLLPLDLEVEDFGGNEKIAYLPRKLSVEGHGPFGNEQPYDLCYYMPWGNLAMFFAPYKHPGLVRLGRFETGMEALHLAGRYPLRIEAID